MQTHGTDAADVEVDVFKASLQMHKIALFPL